MNFLKALFKNYYFPKLLVIVSIILVLSFCMVLFLGLLDKEKRRKKKDNLNNLEDISFNKVSDEMAVIEDVTFEIPSLTKNLENFKESIEKALLDTNDSLENTTEIKRRVGGDSIKRKKILDKEEIDNTAIQPILTQEYEKL